MALTTTFLSTVTLLAVAVAAADTSCSCYSVGNNIFANHATFTFNGATGTKPNAAFTSVLAPQSYTAATSSQAPIAKAFSPSNIYLNEDSTAGTHLRLATSRTGTGQATSELQTKETDILYGSFRVRARVSGASGACASIFTYLDDTNEVDWEFLTKEGNRTFHATNQPGADKGATTPVTVPASMGDWNDWQLDWIPGQTQMLFNGQVVNTKTVNVPTTAMPFLINMWSDGGEWSGEMSEGQAAYLDLLSVEMFYNTSAGGAVCSNICSAPGPSGTATATLAPTTTAATGTPTTMVTSTHAVSSPAASSYSTHTSAAASSAPASAPASSYGTHTNTHTHTYPAQSSPAASASASVYPGILNGGVAGGSIDMCGANNNSASCATGLCCSQRGYCGTSSYYCGTGCQSQFGACGTAAQKEKRAWGFSRMFRA
jgi:Glycosyl hydrolases family 16/Chitin recognition protein